MWENDLAKIMQLIGIHGIMECKNFYERKLTMNLKDYIASIVTIHKKAWPFRDIRPLTDGNAYSYDS